MRAVRRLILAVVLLLGAAAVSRADEPVTLRMAAIAPDGTGWAREMKALSRNIEVGTKGAVRMKWYFGAIAGDELTALDRVRRGQLDGEAGALYCGALSHTMGLLRLAGLAQNRDQALYLLNHLRRRIDAEFHAAGFVPLALGNFGNDIVFLRKPVETLAQLRKMPMWLWNADTLLQKQLRAMGMTVVPGTLEALLPLYDAGKIDAMYVIPSAALAFQWTTRAHYFVDLGASMLPGCIVLSQKAFDQLTFEQQQVVNEASARFAFRFEDLGRREDQLLLGGVLEKQGVRRLAASPALRAAFVKAADEARGQLDEQTLPRAFLEQALAVLKQYQAEHASGAGAP